jgi:Uma2 family endonuclease
MALSFEASRRDATAARARCCLLVICALTVCPYAKVEEPVIAPDVAVEVKSPRDRKADIDEKVRVYLACGSSVVFLVDPSSRTVDIFDARGISHLGADGVIRHEALPRFRLEVRKLFELPRPRRLTKK